MYYYPNHSIDISFWPKTLERYWISTLKRILFVPTHSKNISFQLKTFDKYVVLAQNIRKTIKVTREIFVKYRIFPTMFKNYRIRTQNIRKVSTFYPKHSQSVWFRPEYLKSAEFLPNLFAKYWNLRKTFEMYSICTQHIRTVQNFYVKHFKSIWFGPEIF